MNPVRAIGQVSAIASFDMRRKLLSWRFALPVASAVVILLLAVNTGMSGYSSMHACSNLILPFAGSACTVLAITAASLSSEGLTDEFETGTGYVTFTKPVSRIAVFTGKYLSGFILGLVVLAFYYVVTFSVFYAVAGFVPARAASTVLLAVLFLFAVTGVCNLLSAISPKAGLALTASFLLLILLPVFMQNLSFDNEPWCSLGYSSGILRDHIVYSQTEAFLQNGVMVVDGYEPDLRLSVAVMAAYGAISTALAAWAFRYRHL